MLLQMEKQKTKRGKDLPNSTWQLRWTCAQKPGLLIPLPVAAQPLDFCYMIVPPRMSSRKNQVSLNRLCGEGNVTPLQYFCLENPMDGGVW